MRIERFSPGEVVPIGADFLCVHAVAKREPYAWFLVPDWWSRDVEWVLDRWWRVLAPDNSLWCETSDEAEARSMVRPGDRLENLHVRRGTVVAQQHEWRAVEPDA